MTQDSALPIVLCADESYIKYASVVMISVLKHTKARVRFYLVSDRVLPKATLTKLSYIESTYPNASISHSCHALARFASLPTQGENDSHITYLRLLLDSILPQSVSKCIYLDCDVLVRSDIAGLFSYDLHGALLGAVRDLAFNDASSACRNHLGFYFNAGVLLLDMEKWRESKAGERLFALLEARPQITQGFHDQNLLNECFCDEVCELPLGWNVIITPPHILRFADKDSALGEQCGSVANFVKGTTTKVANLPQSLQSSHSPTATPRILEENQANQSSLRDTAPAVARQSTLESSVQVDSMDCHADFQSARNDRKNATILNEPTKDSRIFTQEVQNVAKSQAEAKVDSSKSPSDSKILDEKCGLQAKAQGSYLSGNDRRAFVQLPHFSLKAESPQAKIPALLCRHSRAAYESALESPYIVHFAAQPKPWGRVCYIKQTHSTLELIEYASPHTKQWWEVARKSPFFTEILRAFIAPTLQAYKTKAIFAAKTKAPRIYAALHALARLFTPSNPSHKEA
ncbi:glycosyltransferase family 8 protein [Helicobacter canis]|uniref:Glycosyltransferase family 8 protein n=1 Tax=Helicobacter canis TaxID=29419 RepID=A0A5M9QNL6_9HELI|nr:glycosyltransferase family 8 protein [Helicobacter canis]KAA8710303.1 glycosyltransferase family 8 protein [Helicobacter canis]